jgi:hypothetical protein
LNFPTFWQVLAIRITIIGMFIIFIYVFVGGFLGVSIIEALLWKAAALSVIRWSLTFLLPPGVAQIIASLLTALSGSSSGENPLYMMGAGGQGPAADAAAVPPAAPVEGIPLLKGTPVVVGSLETRNL